MPRPHPMDCPRCGTRMRRAAGLTRCERCGYCPDMKTDLVEGHSRGRDLIEPDENNTPVSDPSERGWLTREIKL